MATKQTAAIEIPSPERENLTVYILGTTPLLCRRMSVKAKQELLFPVGRRTGAARSASLKHNPIEEYRESPYTLPDAGPDEAFIGGKSSWFKGAMMTAALDLPGAKKAQIGRLLWVSDDLVGIYGVPKLHMSVVRSADMNRTPDIRTRVVVPEWATIINVNFIKPMLRQQDVVNLLATGGLTAGVGDWRPEKGKGTFGQFEIVNYDDPRWRAIAASGTALTQRAAMADPACFDNDTEDLYTWFNEEFKRRGYVDKVALNGHIEEEDLTVLEESDEPEGVFLS